MRKFRVTTAAMLVAFSLAGALTTTSAASANERQPEQNLPPAEAGPRDKAEAARASRPVKDEYIVTVKAGRNPDHVAGVFNARPRFIYRSALNGFAAHLSEGQAQGLRHHPDVEAVEQDQLGGTGATQSMEWWSGQPWGLDRIDQRTGHSWTYNYNGTGSGVRAYVIDSGLQSGHADFGGRALNMYDALGGNGADCNGHGTHVGGTIGGSTYGVAKSAYLRGVRVVDCNGNGWASQAIAGVDWVRANGIRPAVANMSLQYGYTSALNTAVYNLASSGIFVAAAAGNWNTDACSVSPASAWGAYTTAASDWSDNRASFSNFGGCVDGYAPGVNIKSDWIGGGTNVISGTSMASPHVAGTAALYKGNYGDAHWTTIHNWITTNSTAGVIAGNPGGTVNRLLYKAWL